MLEWFTLNAENLKSKNGLLEVIELKFRLKKGRGSVSEFTDAVGVTHVPGDVVDLPASFDGEAWLERVDPEVVVAAVPGRFEPIEAIEPVEAAEEPIEAVEDVPSEDAPKKRARPRKKSES
jgi:hypothetical protein